MTSKIIVVKDNRAVGEFVLSKDRTVIGRRKEADITILDAAVSGLHASIARRGDRFEIIDMQSTNGVHIGGRKIERQLLNDGDLILVGEHYLQYLEGDFEVPPKERSNDPVGPTGGADAPAADGYLMVLSGKNTNQRIELTGALTSIGEPGVQMAAVSQRPAGHFIIHVDGGKDRNRTPLVNGESLGFKSRKLEHGDVLEVADIQMQYFIADRTVIKPH